MSKDFVRRALIGWLMSRDAVMQEWGRAMSYLGRLLPNKGLFFLPLPFKTILIDVWLSDISPTILAHASLIFDLLMMKKTYLSFLDKPEIEFMLLYICLLTD